MTSLRKQSAQRRLDHLIRKYAPRHWWLSCCYWRLIEAIRGKSSLLSPQLARGAMGPLDHERIVRACARLSIQHERWQAAPETWRCPAASLRVQFRELLQHVLDAFPVPNFMAAVWLRDAALSWELDMYLHLAEGKSIRRFHLPQLPMRLSKAASRWFMVAPHDLLPVEAFRWAHVRSLGGDARLARIACSTPPLHTPTEHEPFWESVIRFLVKHEPICEEEVREIIDFIHRQRFMPASRVWGPRAGEQPVQPEFTMRGRTLRSLRRHMVNWREELRERFHSVMPPQSNLWQPSGIRPFTCEQDNGLWTIEEILSDPELRAEGGIMHHCAATYVTRCARRQTTIWSMKVDDGQRRRRVLTIEVLPHSKVIYQARGKHNSPPSEQAATILRRWAEEEALNCSRLTC